MASVKKKFCIEGDIKEVAVHFKEETHAYSEAQAKRFVRFRLEQRFKRKVFLTYTPGPAK